MRPRQLSLLLILLLPLACAAKDLRIAVGSTLPPYFIIKDDSGIEMDIIREAMSKAGYTISPIYLPFGEHVDALRRGEVDCASTISEHWGLQAYLSDVMISYQNYAISLAKDHLNISRIKDLKGKSIIAFPNAHNILGKEYAAAVAGSSHYAEWGNQLLQANNLYLGRTQVIISDYRIFAYYTKKLAHKEYAQQPVVYHNLFPKSDYRLACSDKQVIDDFNKALRSLRAGNLYSRIIAKYQ
jgi:polar amino acid transport system substrate-binding protein